MEGCRSAVSTDVGCASGPRVPIKPEGLGSALNPDP